MFLSSRPSHPMFPTQDAFAGHKAFFRTTAEELIKDHTFKVSGLPGSRLDVVGNVINLAPAYWVANYIVRITILYTCIIC